MASHRLSLCAAGLSALMLLSACSASAPLSMEPVNKIIQTQLPPLDGQLANHSSQMFSFRIITPVEKVDLFSVLQEQNKHFRPVDRNTLPVAQLREVIIAKEKITQPQFVHPEMAGVLIYQTAAFYNWDLEIARQVLTELTQAYVDHRNRNYGEYLRLVDERATYYRERSLRRIEENTRQDAAVIEAMFGNIPSVKPLSDEERERNFKRHVQYTAYMTEKNQRAQAEYARQANAAHAKLMEKLDEQARQAREKEEAANRRRQAELDAILGVEAAEAAAAGMAVQSVTQSAAPYSLLALTNGDFIVESRQALPAMIQIQVDQFSRPVSIPVLPQTRQGRLLLEISEDAQGNPLVRGGLDASAGLRFDLSQPLFTLAYQPDGSQILDFLYPDGRLERFDVAQFQNLESDTALQQVAALQPSLDSLKLVSMREQFANIRYQFTPELAFMDPQQAADVLNSLTRTP